jgi:hypothetical protein
MEWIGKRAMPWLRNRVQEVSLAGNSYEVLVFEEGVYRLEATPNGSYGYLYIGAIQRAEDPSTKPIEELR